MNGLNLNTQVEVTISNGTLARTLAFFLMAVFAFFLIQKAFK